MNLPMSRLSFAGLSVFLAAGTLLASPPNLWDGNVSTGRWSVAANWSRGHAPLVDETVWITNRVSATGHTVTADVRYVSTATNALVIGNSTGTATNTLVIKSGTELDFDRAILCDQGSKYWDVQVQKGGRIVMEDGAVLRRRYGDYGEYYSMARDHYFIRLMGGGVFEQQGGYAGITDNARQGISIGDTSGSVTSVWKMAGGAIYWNTGKVGAANILQINKTGRFEMSGNAVFTNCCNNGLYRPVAHYMQGGVFDISGEAHFTARHGNYHFFGWGDTIFRERARATNDNNPWIYVGCANKDPKGSVARLVVKDDAAFTFYGDPSARVGGRLGCHAVIDVGSTATCQFGCGYFYLGFDEGTAEAWFRGPGVMSVGAYAGLHVGTDSQITGSYADNCSRTSTTTAAPTGTVYMTGGTLKVGAKTSQAWGYHCLVGLVVGDGSQFVGTLTDPFESRLYRGSFFMSGGSVTNEGYHVVGAGRATGLMVQTGGTVYDQCSDNTSMVVGCAGGYGAYVLSNGTVTVKKRLFVGGATTNDLLRSGWTDPTSKHQGGYPTSGNYPYYRHDAKGVLTIAPHDKSQTTKLAVTETITLSSDGAGTLELIGSGATVTAKNMVLSNNVAAVEGGESKVRFVADATGISPITISQNLRIEDGVKLEVDLSAYAGPRPKTFKILDCKTRTGSFAPENVTLTRCRLVVKPNDPDIYVRTRQGLAVMVR